MGEFDDVLSMEPGDEWDDHVIGGSPDVDETHGPLQATLRLPNALVELRGECPANILDTLADLTDERLELLGEPVAVRLSVQRDGSNWAIRGHGEPAVVSGGDDGLLRDLVAQLGRIAIDTDPLRLHLDVAAVRLSGAGIVVVEAHRSALDGEIVQVDPGRASGPVDAGSSARDDRALVVADLIELGAEFVTSELLCLLPGSRTVFGHPAPPSTSTHPPVRASTVAAIAPWAQVDQLVVLRHVPGAAATATELDAAAAAVQLLLSARDLDRIGPAALDVVAQVMGGARCTLVDYSDPRDLAAVIAALPGAGPRRLVVPHRFDEGDDVSLDLSASSGAPVPAAVRRGRASKRVVRFDTTGALHDGSTGVLTTLTPDELDEFEALLVPPSAASGRAGRSAVPERLAAAGVRAPSTGARAVPGVEAFGLPNCPAGATATAMWSGAGAQKALAAACAPGADVPGSVAQAIERGLVISPPSDQGSILDRHELARRLVRVVEDTLQLVLDVAERQSVVPLVLGSSVLVHDGWLPADFTDAEQVDLLVEPDALPTLLDALLAEGFEQVIPPPSEAADLPVAHEVVRPGDVPVTVQLRTRLAVGPFAALVNHEELHDRSVPVRIGPRWCRSLHPEDRFVFTCVQLDLDTSHSTVQDLRDVVLSAPRIEAHMAQALEASERWGATLSTVASLQRVNAVMPGLSPWLVERAERTERSRRRQEKADRPSRGLLRRRR